MLFRSVGIAPSVVLAASETVGGETRDLTSEWRRFGLAGQAAAAAGVRLGERWLTVEGRYAHGLLTANRKGRAALQTRDVLVVLGFDVL